MGAGGTTGCVPAWGTGGCGTAAGRTTTGVAGGVEATAGTGGGGTAEGRATTVPGTGRLAMAGGGATTLVGRGPVWGRMMRRAGAPGAAGGADDPRPEGRTAAGDTALDAAGLPGELGVGEGAGLAVAGGVRLAAEPTGAPAVTPVAPGAAGRTGGGVALGVTTPGRAAAATAGLATAGRGAAAGGAYLAASWACLRSRIAFRASPGLETCDRLKAAAGALSAFRLAPEGRVPRVKKPRTFSASSSSIELECVFFSVTPTAVKASRMDLLLTSSSRARSLIRTLLI